MQYFWRQSQKWKNHLCSFARQIIQYERIEVYAPNINAEEDEVEWFSEDLQDLLELTHTHTHTHTHKVVIFFKGYWNAKVGSQEIPGVTGNLALKYKMKQGKNRDLPRECTGHSKHPLPTTQEMTLHLETTRWSILKSDWLYSLQPKMEKLYTVSKIKTGR